MKKLQHPALLYVGSPLATATAVGSFIASQLCPFGQLPCRCTSCTQVADKQHRAVTWIAPESEYVLDDLAPIFQTIVYKLEEAERYFFVLEHIDNLSIICANKLLKVLEEPPVGYSFLLTTQNQHAVLQTIQSRCQVVFSQPIELQENHPLVSFFVDSEKRALPLMFEKALKEFSPSHTQALEIAYQVQQALWKEEHRNEYYLVCEQIKTPPPSGGGVMFLKRLYMALSVR